LAAARTPPADRSAPEQFLAARRSILNLDRLARQRRARLSKRRRDAPPQRPALSGGLIHRLVETPVVLAPPVAEEILVGALAHLHDRRPAVLDELREEVERDAHVVGIGSSCSRTSSGRNSHLIAIDQRFVVVGLHRSLMRFANWNSL
jgi:hypothetical protein